MIALAGGEAGSHAIIVVMLFFKAESASFVPRSHERTDVRLISIRFAYHRHKVPRSLRGSYEKVDITSEASTQSAGSSPYSRRHTTRPVI